MCLLFAILAVLGPRALVFFWWLLEPARWGATFQSAFVPVIGFLIWLGVTQIKDRRDRGKG